MLKGKEVIIFDLDGTLIDSVGIWNEIDEILINRISNKKVNIHNINEVREKVLRQYNAVDMYLGYCDYLRKEYNSSLTAEEILHLRRDVIAKDYLINKIDYKPNAEKVLHRLKGSGYTLVVATTTSNVAMDIYRNHNKNIINKANIDDMFSLILTKDDVKEKKPSPEVYYKILDILKTEAEKCLAVEDALVGVEAGKNAGIEVATIYDKYSDCDRKEINKLANYNFKLFNEMLYVIEQEVY